MKIIVTLGPSTCTEAQLRKIKDRGVDFVRINMSHSTLDDLRYFMGLAKKVGIPFVIDTEGSQIRTGDLVSPSIFFEENETVLIHQGDFQGDRQQISLKPGSILWQLEPGDLLYPDFDTLVLRVEAAAFDHKKSVSATVIVAGSLGRNKGVHVDSASRKRYDLPVLSPKDHESIRIGLEEEAGYVAASFMRSPNFVREVRQASNGEMKIISKIECLDALHNLDGIIEESDYLLIDRGDLSKEISIERVPFAQKAIIERARHKGKGVFVATNLLESMVEKRKPTRAEVHDIEDTILDGAHGLALAAETAIGKYPLECITMLQKIIRHTESTVPLVDFVPKNRGIATHLLNSNYLTTQAVSCSLVEPHGGTLVERIVPEAPQQEYLRSLPKVLLSDEQYMDTEQIALGTFSPLEGFMGEEDFHSVLEAVRLKSGLVWPLPVILDVDQRDADRLREGEDVALMDNKGEIIAILHLKEKYRFDVEEAAQKLYGTLNKGHPGVASLHQMKAVLLGGEVDLFKRKAAEFKAYELAPRQVRRLFEERGWSKVVGFHTRNPIHRSHEYIQLQAMERAHADGLFVHPVIGKKKSGDFHIKPIIKTYEAMARCFYPKGKVIFGTYASFSRYAGPREALLTALCRKNFGCSHFVVGRDHTGVGKFYHPKASHIIFDQFPEIGIIPIRFDHVCYSNKLGGYVHEGELNSDDPGERLQISGTEIRKIFERGETPPDWLMRPEISGIIKQMLEQGEEVLVK